MVAIAHDPESGTTQMGRISSINHAARDRSRTLPNMVASVAVLAMFATATAHGVADSGTERPPGVREELRHARNLSNAFRTVAKELAPSVVAISTIDRPPYEGQTGPIMLPPGARLPDRQGKGSGVIIAADGLIVTNCHVVRGADEIAVKLVDQRQFPARIVGLDPDSDLAVLQVDATDLVPAEFAELDSIEIGEWVLALGNPFGLEQSVTAGIISAKGRSGMGLATYENFLQTDAAINPGNSGGPLVDLDGRVVGINTAISSPDGVNHGIGFAIPASMVRRVSGELIERGHVTRGWLGVSVAPVLAGSRTNPGAALAFVAPNTPAWSAGLRVGDVIVKLDDQPLDSPTAFIKAIGDLPPRSAVQVTFIRNGEPMTARAVLGERPTFQRQQTPALVPAPDASREPAPPQAPDASSPSQHPRSPAGRDSSTQSRRRVERAQPVE